MRPIVFVVGAALVAAVAGCGSTPATAPGKTPLTVEQWKTLPVQAKYEVETLERLKLGDPKLQDQRAWDKFTREVLLPAKKKDRPDLGVK
jgi:hypothetical protein